MLGPELGMAACILSCKGKRPVSKLGSKEQLDKT
jgi:hypothetical protein